MLCRLLFAGAALLACPLGSLEEGRGPAEEEFLVHGDVRRVERRRVLRRPPPPPPPRRISAAPPAPSAVHPAFVRDVSRLVRPPTA